MSRDYRQSLDALERSVHVPRELQVEEQEVDPPRDYLDPEDFDRLLLLASTTSAGRLRLRS